MKLNLANLRKNPNTNKEIQGTKNNFLTSRFSSHQLIAFGAIFAAVGGFFLYQSFAAPTALLSVEAEAMNRPAETKLINDSSASLGQAVQMTSEGTLSGRFTLTAPSTSFGVRVRGVVCDKNWPKIRLKVDGKIVKTTSNVKAGGWYEKTITTNLAVGNHNLEIDGVNLGSSGSNCTRTLFIDRATFFADSSTTPPPTQPTVTLGASPTSVTSGGSSTLTWNSTNASSCIAGGAWSGTRAAQGSTNTGSLNNTSTYTLTCTGNGGSASQSTTVTVTPTTTPAPSPNPTPTPTPTPPPTSGTMTCLVSNRTQWALAGANCAVGSTVTRTNQGFACSQPLSSYGTLPLKVVINSTSSWGGNGVTLDNGCVGDGNNDTIDLVIVVNGNGQSGGIGPSQDSTKFRQDPGPHDIQLTGKFECGAPGAGAHPDTWQFQSSSTRNMAIVNGTTGNWSAGTSTCQTAGGAMFWSDSTQVDILGGEYVGCNHGILANQSGGSLSRVIDAKFRTGRTESVTGGGDPNCQGFASSPPCLGTTYFAVFQNVTCQRWNSNTNSWDNSTPS